MYASVQHQFQEHLRLLDSGHELRTSPYRATGPNGEVELGLRYAEAARIPEQPCRVLTGCARVSDELLAFSIGEQNRVFMLSVSSAVVREELEIEGAEGLWSDGEGTLLVAQPSVNAYTRVSLSTGSRRRYDLGDVSPCHVAQWGRRLLVVDSRGKCVWLIDEGGTRRRVDTPLRMLVPRAAVPVCDSTFIICDRDAHTAARVHVDGRVLWTYGVFEDPSADTDRLANPEHVGQVGPDSWAVCDMRNSRILILNAQGHCTGVLGSTDSIGSGDGSLWAPVAAASCRGRVVVADSGNARVVEIGHLGPDRTIWGKARVLDSLFHHPRSCTPVGGDFLVADSYHNRVSRISSRGVEVSVVTKALHRRLFWPRNTAVIDSEIFFSDSRNKRIIRQRRSGDEEFVLRRADGSVVPLSDPHSLRCAGDALLITDTDTASCYLVDRSGVVHFIWGRSQVDGIPGMEAEFDDVHDAYYQEGVGVWICDSGNNSVVLVDDGPVRASRSSRVLSTISGIGLASPRSVEVLSGGELLVCDSDNHRILVVDPTGRIRYQYAGRLGHAVGCLAYPRQALIHRGQLVIADCINNRLLAVPSRLLRDEQGESFGGHERGARLSAHLGETP